MTRSVATLLAVWFAGLALAQVQPALGAREYVSGEVLLKFRPGVTPYQMDRLARRLGVRLVPSIAGPDIMKLRGPARWNVPLVVSALRSDPAIEFAEPNGIVHACYPNDQFYGQQQSYMTQIHWPDAMNLYRGSPNIIVAIVDSGVQLDHEDLGAKIVAGWNFVAGNNNPNDDYHHGTHVAGIAAAITDNAKGVAGTCPICSIMPVKVLDSSGNGSWENTAAGINWAADHGAHVINLSLGAFGQNSTAQAAVQRVTGMGVIVVAAAGNSNSSSLFYPAAYPECIAVGAVDGNDSKASFSDYNAGQNQWVDVAAPGVSILSTWTGNGYQFDSGTSMATPFVTGEAALLYGILTDPISPAPRSTDLATRVRALIEGNVDPVKTPPVDWVLKGRINFGTAVTAGLTKVTVNGNVDLDQFLTPTTIPVTVQALSPGTSTVVEAHTVSLDAGGNYSTQFASIGVFDLRFSTGTHFLARRLPNVTLTRMASVAVPQVFLPNGDVDLNGGVGLPDLGLVLVDFGTGAGPADLNGSGGVGLTDIGIVLGSFGLTSDP